MKVEVTYMSGTHTETFIVEGKMKKELEEKIDKEIKRRGWNPKNCWSDTI